MTGLSARLAEYLRLVHIRVSMSKMVGGIFCEHAHQLIASTVGFRRCPGRLA
jgi:hypothetical protein